MRPIIDLSGRVFGVLTVINRGANDGRSPAWNCICACGRPDCRQRILARGENLKTGNTTSCGALHQNNPSPQNEDGLLKITFLRIHGALHADPRRRCAALCCHTDVVRDRGRSAPRPRSLTRRPRETLGGDMASRRLEPRVEPPCLASEVQGNPPPLRRA